MNNTNITKLTQSEAARAAGVSHTSVWRAIRKGKLSAERADDGTIRIDLSELLRVYPQANIERAREHAPDGSLNKAERAPDHAPEVSALRTLVDELQADKRRLLSELDREREERMRAAEERARLLSVVEKQSEQVRLLTDQRERTARPRRWWQRWRRAE